LDSPSTTSATTSTYTTSAGASNSIPKIQFYMEFWNWYFNC
jgi:hypothetical protein